MNTPIKTAPSDAPFNASSNASLNTPLIGFGTVRHTRLRPARNAFAYATYFLMLPMRSLAQGQLTNPHPLAINRLAPISFYDADHGDGRSAQAGGALGWLDALLQAQGIHDATGEVWLHCYPRVLGFTFKPVSFWYCHRAGNLDHDANHPEKSGSLRAIVVEVNNTFGERHCYLLDAPEFGQEIAATKVFHVSPFCNIEGGYRFRFMRAHHAGTERTVARIDYDDIEGPLLQTSVSGMLEPITPAALSKAVWRYPVMTLGVVFHIHFQALRLWLKRVKFFGKPPPPIRFVTGRHID